MFNRRRRTLILAGCACLMLLALGGLWLFRFNARPGVTKQDVDRIQKGMTLAKVQAILGREGAPFYGYVKRTAYYWENADRSYAIVLFGDDKKAVEAKWQDSTESMGDKIRRVVHWPWW